LIYILDTDLPENTTVVIALKRISGIGQFRAEVITHRLGFCRNLKIKDLTHQQSRKLTHLVRNSDMTINTELTRILRATQTRLVRIKSYRGLRKLKGFPVRGQRTRSNSKTSRKRFTSK